MSKTKINCEERVMRKTLAIIVASVLLVSSFTLSSCKCHKCKSANRDYGTTQAALRQIQEKLEAAASRAYLVEWAKEWAAQEARQMGTMRETADKIELAEEMANTVYKAKKARDKVEKLAWEKDVEDAANSTNPEIADTAKAIKLLAVRAKRDVAQMVYRVAKEAEKMLGVEAQAARNILANATEKTLAEAKVEVDATDAAWENAKEESPNSVRHLASSAMALAKGRHMNDFE
jgi:hypothetical protein